jgi:hypothetical protein
MLHDIALIFLFSALGLLYFLSGNEFRKLEDRIAELEKEVDPPQDLFEGVEAKYDTPKGQKTVKYTTGRPGQSGEEKNV